MVSAHQPNMMARRAKNTSTCASRFFSQSPKKGNDCLVRQVSWLRIILPFPSHAFCTVDVNVRPRYSCGDSARFALASLLNCLRSTSPNTFMKLIETNPSYHTIYLNTIYCVVLSINLQYIDFICNNPQGTASRAGSATVYVRLIKYLAKY